VCAAALPDDLRAEVLRPEDLVEQDLHVVNLVGVEVQVQHPVVREELVDEDQPLAQELDELGALDLVAGRELSLAGPELALGRERRIDVGTRRPSGAR